jgi:uncharacterized protein (DUF1800 family)
MRPAPALSRRRLFQAAATTSVALGVSGVAAPRAEAAPVYSSFSPKLPLVTTPEWHLARRAAHAPTAAMAAKIKSMGADAWVDWQLKPSTVPDSVCDGLVAKHLPWLKMTTAQLKSATGGKPWKGAPLVVRAAALRHIFSERVLLESVVEAMSDQVFVCGKGKAETWLLDWDRTVLRKHALGTFSSFLQAALTHPALLVYLDNDASSKDNPNENLGRELLELHTVGTGNYTEADVAQSALLLTGHTVDKSTMTYVYRPEQHHVGPLTVMGFHHPNASAADGPAVLAAYADYLAHHPGTASKVARRLAVRFVSDNPSAALVAALAEVYLASGTEIAAVVRALFRHPEFKASAGKKWRRPQEWAAAMLKPGKPTWKPQGSLEDPWGFLSWHISLLDAAQHAPRLWPAVDGYPDQGAYWMSTHGMLTAWNHAEVAAGRQDKQVPLAAWPTTLGIKAGQNVWTVAAAMTLRLTGYTWRKEDLTVIASLLSSAGRTVPSSKYKLSANNVKNDYKQAVRMVLASPYFMIR